MFGTSLAKAFRNSAFKVSRRSFSILSSDYYQDVLEQSFDRKTIVTKTVKAKIDKKGRTEEIKIYGIPLNLMPVGEHGFNDTLKEIMDQQEGQPMFFQADPTRYLYSQRQRASKVESAENNSPDFLNLLSQDPIHPFSWEEAIVTSEALLELKTSNEGEEESDNENIEEQVKELEARQIPNAREVVERNNKVGQSMYQHVFDTQIGRYPEMNNIMISALILNNPIVLGGMPKILKRLILGNTMKLEDLKTVFKTVCTQSEKIMKVHKKANFSQVARFLFPELFYAPDVMYMSVMMKEMAANNKEGFQAFVGTDYIDAIVDNWQDSRVEGPKFADLLGMPPRGSEDEVDTLIEKHAILDSLIGDSVWDAPYLKNQFPYLNAEENTDATIVDLRKKFFVNYKRYSKLRETFSGKVEEEEETEEKEQKEENTK